MSGVPVSRFGLRFNGDWVEVTQREFYEALGRLDFSASFIALRPAYVTKWMWGATPVGFSEWNPDALPGCANRYWLPLNRK